MSTIPIASRSAGQVILASFFNDIQSAFGGDFVGRDVNGNPASGNNLGTAAYPWGAVYAEELIVGGSAFSAASLETSPYQIVSGKTRSGSNQPAFLVPAGSAATFSLLASSTNLVLLINGVGATWTADKTSIPVTTAPASGNTCTVNDASASGQVATRIWGEYGSGSGTPYYPITVSGMGASISARVGSWQAFKIGSEYFLAYIDSTTSLSRAFRGFFFNSSGNPVERSTFSNGATITLMNLGWVFADQDGTTADTIFVGAGVNNTPTFAFTAPSAPATGDYWFDQGNQVWNRYSGSIWAIVNRIPVGLVVADGTNCVGARSFDFFGLYRNDNTFELDWFSNTVLKAKGLFERINVMGKRISFQTSRATWDTASNLAASTDRYNSTVQASTTEYFYVTDQGDTKISDIEPYWRPDFIGWYHPYNPWRCVGSTFTDGSANFLSSTIIGIQDRARPQLIQQISSGSNGFSTSSTSPTGVSGLSVTISTTGRPVFVGLIPTNGSGAGYVGCGASSGSDLTILRDSSAIALFELSSQSGGLIRHPAGPWTIDFPPAGTHTYSVQANANVSDTIFVNNLSLVAFEL